LVLAEAAATNAETAIAEREAIAIEVAKLENSFWQQTPLWKTSPH
jgi:hypothetical protein